MEALLKPTSRVKRMAEFAPAAQGGNLKYVRTIVALDVRLPNGKLWRVLIGVERA